MEIKNSKKERRELFEGVKDRMTQGFNKAAQKLDDVVSAVTEAFKDTTFYDVRTSILQYLEKKQNLKSAVVNVQIVENRGFYDASWRIIFSQVSESEGKVLETSTATTKGITEVHLPDYILDSIRENGSVEIKFNETDLNLLYREKDEDVIENCQYSEIVDACKENGVTRIVLCDRVFYTHVDFYDGDNLMDAKCFEKIMNLPEQVQTELYPCAQYELSF